ncbi:class D sortase [Neobacillus sp. D3-1R]|uniref:class D sortase n=1 Tax=Neobacillus sp. D3-1R TaxID=3445778 RepID=UPI003F9F2DBB
MKMRISLLFLAGGFFFITLAGYQIVKSSFVQTKTLSTAIKEVRERETALLDDQAETVKNGEVLGVLELPTLNEKLPIVKGVTEEALEKGVGYYEGTALPNQHDQIVLSGHRDTVFKRLGKLKIGDELVVEMPYGSFTYIIEETFIVEANDRTVIHSTAPVEKLTLTTCYPFHYVGNAPQRYIINAKRK